MLEAALGLRDAGLLGGGGGGTLFVALEGGAGAGGATLFVVGGTFASVSQQKSRVNRIHSHDAAQMVCHLLIKKNKRELDRNF